MNFKIPSTQTIPQLCDYLCVHLSLISAMFVVGWDLSYAEDV